MLKRLTVAVAALFVLASSAFGAGTIPYSLSQQLDEFGNPLAGCKLYIIQAGTTSTPQNPYQDSGLTILLANPIICDASGRLPQFFLADGSIKVRLTKSTGVNVVTADGILVVGASSGGGGGSPVDATTILATGDLKIRHGTGILSGFVRANGRTIGSATSGATERANADTQALFTYLWDTDANLSVSTGRGVSSAADWAANKTIALPDARGRGIAGLDDMGTSAAGRLTATYFGATGGCSGALGTTLGAACGGESQTLTLAQLPTGITASGSNSIVVASTNGLTGIPTTTTAGNVSASSTGTGGAIGPASSSGSWAGTSTTCPVQTRST
jgi:hypothetical protein